MSISIRLLNFVKVHPSLMFETPDTVLMLKNKYILNKDLVKNSFCCCSSILILLNMHGCCMYLHIPVFWGALKEQCYEFLRIYLHMQQILSVSDTWQSNMLNLNFLRFKETVSENVRHCFVLILCSSIRPNIHFCVEVQGFTDISQRFLK